MYTIELAGNIPRRDEVTINETLWYFNYSYNSYDGLIYVELENGNGEFILDDPYPIKYGNPLFMQYLTDGNVWSKDFPQAFIIPNFTTNEVKDINIDNYSDVILYVNEVTL